MKPTFKIKEAGGWTDIEITYGAKTIEFSASYVYESSFQELSDILLRLCKDENLSELVTFDLEAQGITCLHFSTIKKAYSCDLVRLTVYNEAFWSVYDDVYDDKPINEPQIVLDIIIYDLHSFVYGVVSEFIRIGKDTFSGWEVAFFDNSLQELRKQLHL